MVKVSDIVAKIREKDSASRESRTERHAAQAGDGKAHATFLPDAGLEHQERLLEELEHAIPEEGTLPFIGSMLRDIRDALTTQKRAGKWMLWLAVATLILVGTQFVLNAWLDWDRISAIWVD